MRSLLTVVMVLLSLSISCKPRRTVKPLKQGQRFHLKEVRLGSNKGFKVVMRSISAGTTRVEWKACDPANEGCQRGVSSSPSFYLAEVEEGPRHLSFRSCIKDKCDDWSEVQTATQSKRRDWQQKAVLNDWGVNQRSFDTLSARLESCRDQEGGLALADALQLPLDTALASLSPSQLYTQAIFLKKSLEDLAAVENDHLSLFTKMQTLKNELSLVLFMLRSLKGTVPDLSLPVSLLSFADLNASTDTQVSLALAGRDKPPSGENVRAVAVEFFPQTHDAPGEYADGIDPVKDSQAKIFEALRARALEAHAAGKKLTVFDEQRFYEITADGSKQLIEPLSLDDITTIRNGFEGWSMDEPVTRARLTAAQADLLVTFGAANVADELMVRGGVKMIDVRPTELIDARAEAVQFEVYQRGPLFDEMHSNPQWLEEKLARIEALGSKVKVYTGELEMLSGDSAALVKEQRLDAIEEAARLSNEINVQSRMLEERNIFAGLQSEIYLLREKRVADEILAFAGDNPDARIALVYGGAHEFKDYFDGHPEVSYRVADGFSTSPVADNVRRADVISYLKENGKLPPAEVSKLMADFDEAFGEPALRTAEVDSPAARTLDVGVPAVRSSQVDPASPLSKNRSLESSDKSADLGTERIGVEQGIESRTLEDSERINSSKGGSDIVPRSNDRIRYAGGALLATLVIGGILAGTLPQALPLVSDSGACTAAFREAYQKAEALREDQRAILRRFDLK